MEKVIEKMVLVLTICWALTNTIGSGHFQLGDIAFSAGYTVGTAIVYFVVIYVVIYLFAEFSRKVIHKLIPVKYEEDLENVGFFEYFAWNKIVLILCVLISGFYFLILLSTGVILAGLAAIVEFIVFYAIITTIAWPVYSVYKRLKLQKNPGTILNIKN